MFCCTFGMCIAHLIKHLENHPIMLAYLCLVLIMLKLYQYIIKAITNIASKLLLLSGKTLVPSLSDWLLDL